MACASALRCCCGCAGAQPPPVLLLLRLRMCACASTAAMSFRWAKVLSRSVCATACTWAVLAWACECEKHTLLFDYHRRTSISSSFHACSLYPLCLHVKARATSKGLPCHYSTGLHGVGLPNQPVRALLRDLARLHKTGWKQYSQRTILITSRWPVCPPTCSCCAAISCCCSSVSSCCASSSRAILTASCCRCATSAACCRASRSTSAP